MTRLQVRRLRVRFHYETRHPCEEVVSVGESYTDDEVRAACAASQGWPFDVSSSVVIDNVEVIL